MSPADFRRLAELLTAWALEASRHDAQTSDLLHALARSARRRARRIEAAS